MERAFTQVERASHRAANLLDIRGDGARYPIGQVERLVHGFHYSRGVVESGVEHDLAGPARQAVICDEFATNELFDDVIDIWFLVEVSHDIGFVFQLVGPGGTHADIGLGHHRQANLSKPSAELGRRLTDLAPSGRETGGCEA